MLTRKLLSGLLVCIFTIPFVASANRTSGWPQGEPVPPAPIKSEPPGPDRPYFQCSAHHTDDDFRLHYGVRAVEECDAEESAVKICEDYEKHECEVHECRYFLQSVDQ